MEGAQLRGSIYGHRQHVRRSSASAYMFRTRQQMDAIRDHIRFGSARALREHEAKVAACEHADTTILDIPDTEDDEGRLIDGGLQVRCVTCDSVRGWL